LHELFFWSVLYLWAIAWEPNKPTSSAAYAWNSTLRSGLKLLFAAKTLNASKTVAEPLASSSAPGLLWFAPPAVESSCPPRTTISSLMDVDTPLIFAITEGCLKEWVNNSTENLALLWGSVILLIAAWYWSLNHCAACSPVAVV